MKIIYILTIIIMGVLYLIKYKNENKENMLKWIGIGVMILLCYNICISVILSFLKIKVTLFSLAIINILTNILLGMTIYKDEKMQKYSIHKMDICAVIIIIIVTTILSIKFYGFPMNIQNSITDSAVHYFASKDFYNQSMLLMDKNSDILNLWTLHFLMPGAYINTGIIFKIFSGIVSETNFCIIYQIFNIIIWSLSAMLMYVLLSKNKKSNKERVLPLVFSLVYMLGYPLNSLISGFAYLSLALNIIIAIIIIMQEEISYLQKNILMFLLNFGVMFSYYFFAPVVYLSIFLQIIINIKKSKKKIFEIKNIINILVKLIIPGMFGVFFFIIFQSLKFGTQPLSNYTNIIAMPGSIYNNLLTNIILFIIVGMYFVINKIRNKDINFQIIMFVLSLIFTFLLWLGNTFKMVSDYYFYKSYYMLWILVICVAFNGISLLLKKSKKVKIITITCLLIYFLGIVGSIVLNKNLLFFDIFVDNNEYLNLKEKIVTSEELKILEYYNKNINHIDNQTYLCLPDFGYGRAMWIYAITENPYNFVNLMYANVTDKIEQFIESDKSNMVLFKRDYEGNYENLKNEIQTYNLKVLYENKEGMILEKN